MNTTNEITSANLPDLQMVDPFAALISPETIAWQHEAHVAALVNFVLDSERKAEVEFKAYRKAHECPKCNGAGQLNEYRHVDHGICFKCGGTGYLP